MGVDSLNNYYDVKLKKARLSVLDSYKNNFSFLKVDFFDTKKFFQKVGKFKIDKIIHLAAQAGVRYSMENPYTYVDTNITGTINIFEFAKRHKIRQVVYASSSSVYGLNKTQPFQENLCVETPISVYAASKKANELFAHVYSHLYDINAIGLRFFTVYGPWGRPDMAYFKFAQKILKGEPIQVYNNGDMSRSFTYIDDVAEGTIKALSLGKKYEIYNLGGSEVVKLMDFIKEIELALGVKAKLEMKGMQPGDMKDTVASTKIAQADLGYNAKTTLKEGMKKFAEWFLQNKKMLLDLKPSKQ